MKKYLSRKLLAVGVSAWAASFVISFSGCSKTPSEPVATPAPTPAPMPATTPAPSPSPVVTPAPTATPVVMGMEAPAASPSATPNSYYLTERVSFTTSDGIVGYPAGTAVSVIGEDAAGIKVRTADGAEIIVQQNQITNNGAASALYLKADEAAQQRIKAEAQARLDANIALQKHAAAVAVKPQAIPIPSATPPWTSIMDAPYDKQREMAPSKKKKR